MDEEKVVTRRLMLRALTLAIEDEEKLGRLVNGDPAMCLLLPIIIIEVWNNLDKAIKEEEEE